jgi:hypothetical protein
MSKLKLGIKINNEIYNKRKFVRWKVHIGSLPIYRFPIITILLWLDIYIISKTLSHNNGIWRRNVEAVVVHFVFALNMRRRPVQAVAVS